MVRRRFPTQDDDGSDLPTREEQGLGWGDRSILPELPSVADPRAPQGPGVAGGPVMDEFGGPGMYGDIGPGSSGVAGNRQGPRDLFPSTSLAPMSAPTAVEDVTSMLPHGVEAMASASESAPLQPSTPTPTSTKPGMPPAAVAGPARQPFRSPVNLFSGGGHRSLIGRAGGLTGGGIGMPGGPSGGPKPTAQMLALLKALQGGSEL